MSDEDRRRDLELELERVKSSIATGLSGMNILTESLAGSVTRHEDRLNELSERVTVMNERMPEDVKSRVTLLEDAVRYLKSHGREVTDKFRVMEIDVVKETTERRVINRHAELSNKAWIAIAVATISGMASLIKAVIDLWH